MTWALQGWGGRGSSELAAAGEHEPSERRLGEGGSSSRATASALAAGRAAPLTPLHTHSALPSPPAPAPPPGCRHVAVHPTLPYILTCSDDMLIKLWDWDKGWACTSIFEGHSHYVMQVGGGGGVGGGSTGV